MASKNFPVRRVSCRPRRCSVMWCNNLATDIYTKGVREAFSGNPVRLCRQCAEEIGRLAGLVLPEEVTEPEEVSETEAVPGEPAETAEAEAVPEAEEAQEEPVKPDDKPKGRGKAAK